MKSLIIYIILLLSFGELLAQEQNCHGTYDIKAEKYFFAAQKKSKISRNDAEKLLFQAIKLDPKYTDAYFLLGVIYYEKAVKLQKKQTITTEITEIYRKSRKAFKRVIKLCEKYQDYESYWYVGKTFYNSEKYLESRNFFNYYKNNTSQFIKIKETELLIDEVNEYIEIKGNPVKYIPTPVNYINTLDDEFLPMISPDGEYLFYTRKSIIDSEIFHEIFMKSYRINPSNLATQLFSKGDTLQFPFNDGRNQGASTITLDNSTMYMTICGIEKDSYTSYKNCDIYVTHKINGKWDYLKVLGKNINGKSSFESQPSVNSYGNTLYFASARESGFGGIDIYRSVKDENGNWQKAQNLGPQINTAGDDKTPFIHSDGKTLYFSSNARPGVGGFDVYFSQYDSITGWSEVENIGYPINTVNDELAFCVSVDGSTIYFSTNKISKTENWDIYTTVMPESARPQKMLLVKGKVIGDDGDTLTSTKVILTSLQTNKETEGIVEQKTGNYAVSVKVEKGERFIIEAQKEGYFYYTECVNPDDEKYIPPSNLNMEVKKITKNKTYEIPIVYFDINSFQLNDTSKLGLKPLINFLNNNKNITIKIYGHTDNLGSDALNLRLSYNRANTVKAYLIEKGISTKRLKIKAYGEGKPEQTNKTEQGRSKNRRVELVIL